MKETSARIVFIGMNTMRGHHWHGRKEFHDPMIMLIYMWGIVLVLAGTLVVYLYSFHAMPR